MNAVLELMRWLYDFWMWCAIINLTIMIIADAKQNVWSKPRDYLNIVALGPITLSLLIYTMVQTLLGEFEKARKKRKR